MLELDSFIGAQVRAHRRARGISQAQLATALGLTYQQVQKYERGVNRVSTSMLVRISEFLDVSIIDFLPKQSGASKAKIDTTFANFHSTSGSREIAEIYAFLPPPKRQLLLALCRSMKPDATSTKVEISL